jgi:transposase-like protein
LGLPRTQATARTFNISPATAHKWWHRHLAGEALRDRSSDSRRSPRLLGEDMTLTTEVSGSVAEMSIVDGVRDTYDWYRRNVAEA